VGISETSALQYIVPLQRYQKIVVRNISGELVFSVGFLSFFAPDKYHGLGVVGVVFWVNTHQMDGARKGIVQIERKTLGLVLSVVGLLLCDIHTLGVFVIESKT